MLKKRRDLVNTAVKLINGYMNCLKKAGKKPTISKDSAEYLTADDNHPDNFSPITDAS